MKKIFILIIAALGLTVSSCNFLDVVPAGKVTEADLFKTHVQADKFAASLYWYQPDRYATQGSIDIASGGDMVSSYYGSVYYFKWKSWVYDNLESPSNTYYAFWSQSAKQYPGGYTSKAVWTGVRNAYMLLENAQSVADATEEEKNRWMGEGYFIIAYLHQTLLEYYGPIPLVKEMADLNSADMTPRSPYVECVQFISDMYDEAAKYLPRTQPANYYGRATKATALAYKARAWMYAASPLVNGNSEWYAGFNNPDGTPLIPQTYNKELWKTAMDASEAAIVEAEGAGYGLYSVSNEVTAEAGYANFRASCVGPEGSTKSFNVKEHLFSLNGNHSYNCKNFGPRYKYVDKYTGGKVQYYRDGWRGYFVPTLDCVRSFLTENGLPWDVDPVTKNLDEFAVPAGEETCNLHLHRDPRFYATVGYDRGEYDIDGTTIVLNCRFGETSQNDMSTANEYQSATGYYTKKWVKKGDNFNYDANSFTNNSYSFPYMRVAELYLNYAEAEASYSGSLSSKGLGYLNKVRNRSGIQNFEKAWALVGGTPTGDVLLKAIRQERLAEFALEGRWFHDLRRWKAAGKILGKTPTGLNIAGATAAEFYKETPIIENQTRTYTVPKNIWLAVPQDQININSNLVQNPGY